MKPSFLRTIAWLFLSIVFLYLVNIFTIRPEVTSGNGNLGLVVVLPAVIVFLFFTKNLWRILPSLNWSSRTRTIIGVGCLFILLVCSYLEYRFALNLIEQLGGTPEHEASRIYRFPWLNQYTNTLFINVYTFFMINSAVVFVYSILRKKPNHTLYTNGGEGN